MRDNYVSYAKRHGAIMEKDLCGVPKSPNVPTKKGKCRSCGKMVEASMEWGLSAGNKEQIMAFFDCPCGALRC